MKERGGDGRVSPFDKLEGENWDRGVMRGEGVGWFAPANVVKGIAFRDREGFILYLEGFANLRERRRRILKDS